MSDVDIAAEELKALEDDAIQYLTFCLNTHVVALPLKSVKEVMTVKAITLLPRTPEFIRGVINLRGQIVPVIDLKLKFNMGITQFVVDTCIIIVEVSIDGRKMLFGALVDAVRDVVESTINNADPAPKMGSAMDAKFILGMDKYADEFFTILDLNVLFSIEQLLDGADTTVISASVI